MIRTLPENCNRIMSDSGCLGYGDYASHAHRFQHKAPFRPASIAETPSPMLAAVPTNPLRPTNRWRQPNPIAYTQPSTAELASRS